MRKYIISFILTVLSYSVMLALFKFLDNRILYTLILPSICVFLSVYFYFRNKKKIGLGIFSGGILINLIFFILLYKLENLQ